MRPDPKPIPRERQGDIMETLSVATRSRCEMRDITAQVRDLVARGRQQGRRCH